MVPWSLHQSRWSPHITTGMGHDSDHRVRARHTRRVIRDEVHGPGAWPEELIGTVGVTGAESVFEEVHTSTGVARTYWITFDEPQMGCRRRRPLPRDRRLSTGSGRARNCGARNRSRCRRTSPKFDLVSSPTAGSGRGSSQSHPGTPSRHLVGRANKPSPFELTASAGSAWSP